MKKENIKILAIESSCDDTSAAVIIDTVILSNVIATQQIHEEYGGVVPELASREHQKNIVPVVDAALKKANLNLDDIDAIAFTRGPGLMGSLLVGTSFAKSLGLSLNIPIIEVNHMQAHILSHFIEDANESAPSFPFLCLTVSGGHTQIVKVTAPFELEVLGSTLDDAAGEAFDKTAKILGLGYPGGPVIDALAKNGDPNKFRFSKPRVDGLDFSFSGLKTSILYFVQKELKTNSSFIEENKEDLSASIQKTIVDILIDKIAKACKDENINEVCLAGGVSANSELRNQLQSTGLKKGWNVYVPKFEYCTDNAAMIAIVGYYSYLENRFCDQSISPLARLKL